MIRCEVAEMADATFDRKSMKRISDIISHFHPCSPIGTTIRNYPKVSASSPIIPPPTSGRKRKSVNTCSDTNIDIFLDYYKEGIEFYRQLGEKCENMNNYSKDTLSQMQNVVNNKNLNLEIIPPKYKQTLLKEQPIRLDDSNQLLVHIQNSVQSDLEKKRAIFHTSEKRARKIAEYKSELKLIIQEIHSINLILTPLSDPIHLFKELIRYN
ncbi:hypothetical protein LOD99_10682 [Oopsacas minuta]|uniref:Uncharacterized protein n=1 Tax=Oopsacas minuta TaxID=111878 RepID=A0AAV7KHX3_9METZ|nr:hypothetical protein LOD99_10682 [Oopsacas minuta]